MPKNVSTANNTEAVAAEATALQIAQFQQFQAFLAMQAKAPAAPIPAPKVSESESKVKVPRDDEKEETPADGSKSGVLGAWKAREAAFTQCFTAQQKLRQSTFFTTQRSFTACVKEAFKTASREEILSWDKSERYATAVGKILKVGKQKGGKPPRQFTPQEAELWVSIVGELGTVDKAVKFCQLIARMKLAGKLSE